MAATRKKPSLKIPRLTLKESELLKLLENNPGRFFSRSYLLKTIWGYNDNTRTRTVDVHVSRLRKKLEHRRDILIHTVVRQGYVLQLNGSGSRTQLEASVVPIREPGGGGAGQAYAATVGSWRPPHRIGSFAASLACISHHVARRSA